MHVLPNGYGPCLPSRYIMQVRVLSHAPFSEEVAQLVRARNMYNLIRKVIYSNQTKPYTLVVAGSSPALLTNLMLH